MHASAFGLFECLFDHIPGKTQCFSIHLKRGDPSRVPAILKSIPPPSSTSCKSVNTFHLLVALPDDQLQSQRTRQSHGNTGNRLFDWNTRSHKLRAMSHTWRPLSLNRSIPSLPTQRESRMEIFLGRQYRLKRSLRKRTVPDSSAARSAHRTCTSP